MTVYIVKKENELCIYQIRDEQKEAFLADYGDSILLSSVSIEGVLIKYGELLKWLDANRNESSQ
jgi:hypothetical protein